MTSKLHKNIPSFTFEEQENLFQAHLALGKLEATIELVPEVRLFLYNYFRKEAVLSLQFEAHQTSLRDLLLYELQLNPQTSLKQAREVSTYVRALVTGINKIRLGSSFTKEFIYQLYEILLFSENLKEKQSSNTESLKLSLERFSIDFEAFFQELPAHTPSLIKAALCHAFIETYTSDLPYISRFSRLLSLLILMKLNLLKEPMLYLSLYYRSFKNEYENTLKLLKEKADAKPWILFFTQALTKVCTEVIQNTQNLSSLLKKDKERINSLGKLAPSALEVLEAFSYKPIANTTYLHQKTGITHATINKVLVDLQKLNIIEELTGQKRARIFAYKAYMSYLT